MLRGAPNGMLTVPEALGQWNSSLAPEHLLGFNSLIFGLCGPLTSVFRLSTRHSSPAKSYVPTDFH